MVISIGYRVKSKRGILFRYWANNILREYLLKGYVINENRVTVSNENYIELMKESVVAKNATTAKDGITYLVTFYNLDIVISIGYRINSLRGVVFRI